MSMLVIQILFFSPASLEQTHVTLPENLLNIPKKPASPKITADIPVGKIPEYSIKKLNLTASKGESRDWRLIGKKAQLYRKENLIHAQEVECFLYNGGEEPTRVTGREAKYYLDRKDVEIFGDVVTVFPDGFTLRSDYMKYNPKDRTVQIPEEYLVKGEGEMDEEKDMKFDSKGLYTDFDEMKVILPKDVVFVMDRKGPKKKHSKGVSDSTQIESDQCLIDRTQKIAYFTMRSNRPPDQRFVRVKQPSTHVRSRTVDLNYGDFKDIVHYMTAHTDVLIREFNDEGVTRYATCGQADFDTQENRIILREYPQVYQDRDTVTGDIIRIYRESDIVDIEHSNAFNEGT